MAEVYGVKPKKFTKEWWPYYWMYYKWQTIGVLIAALMIIVTVVQCATKEKFDLVINYAGTGYIPPEVLSQMEAELEPSIIDCDGNGEKNIFVQEFNFQNKPGSEESDYAMQTKHDVELSNDNSYLYIYDKDELELMLDREFASDTYTEVHEWAGEDIDDGRLAYSDDGVACAVSVDGSELFHKLGIRSENMYIAVKRKNSDEGLNKSAYESAVKAAKIILK